MAWWQDIQHSTAVVQEVCGRTLGGGGGWMTGENQNNCVSRASNSSTGTLQKSACFHAG